MVRRTAASTRGVTWSPALRALDDPLTGALAHAYALPS